MSVQWREKEVREMIAGGENESEMDGREREKEERQKAKKVNYNKKVNIKQYKGLVQE